MHHLFRSDDSLTFRLEITFSLNVFQSEQNFAVPVWSKDVRLKTMLRNSIEPYISNIKCSIASIWCYEVHSSQSLPTNVVTEWNRSFVFGKSAMKSIPTNRHFRWVASSVSVIELHSITDFAFLPPDTSVYISFYIYPLLSAMKMTHRDRVLPSFKRPMTLEFLSNFSDGWQRLCGTKLFLSWDILLISMLNDGIHLFSLALSFVILSHSPVKSCTLCLETGYYRSLLCLRLLESQFLAL